MRAVTIAILAAASGQAPPGRAVDLRLTCLAPNETRELLQTHQYIRPIRALAEASRGGAGEPIGIRMCRLNGSVVYDVRLLRHDGRVVTTVVDAARGAPIAGPAPVLGAEGGRMLAPAPPSSIPLAVSPPAR